ncbi:MAG TPA: TPM domain-containing protein [Bacteroidales bacterium]|nr:TPM domain-containing protein [Bacteroidales bacterium]
MVKTAKDFIDKEQREDLRHAILNAELDTSGEIRVHIETTCKGDVLDRAAFIFKQMGMHKTEKRNGVLFYLAVKNRRFAVIGDTGINAVVPDAFWDDLKHMMLNHFRENHFTQGLVEAIGIVGEKLKNHFPYQRGDVNELSDEISFGD